MALRTLKKIKPLHPNLVPPSGAEVAGKTEDGQRQLYTYSRKMARNVPMYACGGCGNEYGVSEHEDGIAGNEGGVTGKESDHRSPCCGERGNRVWKTNRMTGEQVIKKNTYEIYEEHLLFYLESEGNGNVRMIQYTPMTEEERRERERRLMVEREGPALIAAMLEEGVTPEKLREWASRGVGDEDATVGAEGADGQAAEVVPEPKTETADRPLSAPDTNDYPKMHGPMLWFLSAEHEQAVEVGEAEAFRGKKAEAEEAVAGIEKDYAEVREAADAIPEL